MSTPGIEKIVERQMRNFELAQQQQAGETPTRTKPVFAFVTISRQKSSGGSALARALGEQTGWQVYDQEILNYMAQNNTFQERIYELADERVMGYFESVIESLGSPGRQPGMDYFNKLVSSVTAIAYSNHAVFVGRGVNFMLPPVDGLRVRVIAPDETRAERHAQDTNCSVAEAAGRIAGLDAGRDRFLQDHFHVDTSSPEHYDMVINTETLTTDAAAKIVIAGLEAKTNTRIRRTS